MYISVNRIKSVFVTLLLMYVVGAIIIASIKDNKARKRRKEVAINCIVKQVIPSLKMQVTIKWDSLDFSIVKFPADLIENIQVGDSFVKNPNSYNFELYRKLNGDSMYSLVLEGEGE